MEEQGWKWQPEASLARCWQPEGEGACLGRTVPWQSRALDLEEVAHPAAGWEVPGHQRILLLPEEEEGPDCALPSQSERLLQTHWGTPADCRFSDSVDMSASQVYSDEAQRQASRNVAHDVLRGNASVVLLLLNGVHDVIKGVACAADLDVVTN